MPPALRLPAAVFVWAVVADRLLRVPWGVGVPLSAAGLIVAAWLAGVRIPAPRRQRVAAALLGVLGAAAVFALREHPLVRLSAALAGVTALGWAAAEGLATNALHLRGIRRVLGAGLAGGVPLLAGWERPSSAAVPAWAPRVGRGLLVSLPFAALFLTLFAAADPVLAASIERVLDIDGGALARTAFGVALWGWLGVGAILAVRAPAASVARLLPTPGRIEALTVAVVLTAVFAAAVALQLRYLFGGDAYLAAVADLTRAEYARRGFFELLAIAALAIPTIIWLRRPGVAGPGEPALTGLLLALVGMLGLVLWSAADRLAGYHAAFGLSMARLYGGVVELWLAGAVAWLGVLVARGGVGRFLPPMAAWGVTLVLATAAANPAAIVQRVNLARAARGAGFDVEYGTHLLGTDGRGALVAGLDRLPRGVRCAVTRQLSDHPTAARRGAAWTLTRHQAVRAERPIRSCVYFDDR